MRNTILSIIFAILMFILEVMPPSECSLQTLNNQQLSSVESNVSTTDKPKEQTKDSFLCILQDFVVDNKMYFGGSVGFLYIFVIAAFEWRDSNKTRCTIHDMIDVFMSETLKDREDHRITIFQRVGFVKALWYYCRTTIPKLQAYIKKGKLKTRLSQCPIPLTKYLIIYARFGHPNQSIRSTIFKIHKHIDDSNSFAEYVCHAKLPKEIELPDLSGIDIVGHKTLNDIQSPQKKTKVREYMRQAHVANFNSLKMFSRLSPYIRAIPYYLKRKSMNMPSHVFVYDSEVRKKEEFDQPIYYLSVYLEKVLINK